MEIDGFAVTVFIEWFHSCYRDDLNDSGKNIRDLSVLYFFLRFAGSLAYYLFPFIQELVSLWICPSLGFTIISLIITYLKPYKKKYMTIVDTLLLINLAAMSLAEAQSLSVTRTYMALGLVLLPVLVFIIVSVSVATCSQIWKTLHHQLIGSCKHYNGIGVQIG